jgi:hypothetical protein
VVSLKRKWVVNIERKTMVTFKRKMVINISEFSTKAVPHSPLITIFKEVQSPQIVD